MSSVIVEEFGARRLNAEEGERLIPRKKQQLTKQWEVMPPEGLTFSILLLSFRQPVDAETSEG